MGKIAPENVLGGKNRMNFLDRLALILVIIGGANWGLVGLFQFDLVAWLFSGSASLLSRVIYVVIALAAVWCITLLFRTTGSDSERSR